MDNVAQVKGDEIGLLDLVVAVAESWKLLVIGPLLAGLVAYAALSAMWPRQYESQALLLISPSDAAQLRSARVLDGAIRQSGWLQEYENSLTRARTALIQNLAVEAVEGAAFYRVSLAHRSPEEANALLQLIIRELIAKSQPIGDQREAIEHRLASQNQALDELTRSLERLNRLHDRALAADGGDSTVALGEIGASIVALVGSIEEKQNEILETELELIGSVSEADVLQPATLADSPVNRGVLMRVGLISFATGVGILMVAGIREGLRRAGHTAEGAEKVARIRRAFRIFKPRSR